MTQPCFSRSSRRSPNKRVQRTRSSASPLRSPLTRRPLGVTDQVASGDGDARSRRHLGVVAVYLFGCWQRCESSIMVAKLDQRPRWLEGGLPAFGRYFHRRAVLAICAVVLFLGSNASSSLLRKLG